MKPLIYRQSAWTRATHWVWAICLFFLLLSGLQIFNAHPALYVGQESGFAYDNVPSGRGEVLFYGSIDMIDARHPQTILAYGLNGARLPVANGAPLRLRVERQLGYKMSKFIKSIELVSSFAGVQGGRGGYWEDHGYEWYAGI